MKALKCEMCGSDNLLKQDGMYICQMCGTKYTTEEARKLMIEGTVDVSGSKVKVDDSDKISNYLLMAENAYDANNKKEAEIYCNKIIETSPDNYKAWLLKGKAAGWQSTIANVRIEESVNCFIKAVDNAPEVEKESVKKEASEEVENLSSALIGLCCDNFAELATVDNANRIINNLKLTQLYSITLLLKCGVSANGFKKSIATRMNNSAMDAWNNKIWNDYWDDGHPSKYQWERFIEQGDAAISILLAAINLCDDDDDADIIRYKNLIALQTKLYNSSSYTYSSYGGGYIKEYSLTEQAKTARIDKIMTWHNKIKEIDPNYVIPERPKMKSGGCYVATCVYGSYDCPQVWTLRRYRDYTLAETWYGRAFIHTYYAISPTIVKLFGNTKWFKKLWRGKLDRMVNKLNNSGVEDTPYEDKTW